MDRRIPNNWTTFHRIISEASEKMAQQIREYEDAIALMELTKEAEGSILEGKDIRDDDA